VLVVVLLLVLADVWVLVSVLLEVTSPLHPAVAVRRKEAVKLRKRRWQKRVRMAFALARAEPRGVADAAGAIDGGFLKKWAGEHTWIRDIPVRGCAMAHSGVPVAALAAH